jgi:N-acyl-phosphatidylethanolamine-hydrolysing phospholipase D
MTSRRRICCVSSYIFDSARWLAPLLIALALAACGSANPYYNPAKPHHRPSGFENNYPTEPLHGLWAVIQWRVSSWAKGIPKLPVTPTPELVPDLGAIEANARAGVRMQPALTWIGHATALVQAGGLNVLTDPQFSERASPLSWAGPKRLYAPAISPVQLPHIDVVLISHNHYDHLDTASVKVLNAQAGGPPLFIVPLGLKPWLAAQGIANTVELDWWDAHKVGGAEFVLTPVQHWSSRKPWDRKESLWGGFAVFAPEFHWFFSGDTGYSKDFADIAARFAPRQPGQAQGGGFDLALLPVGCYEPRWFMKEQHLNPDDSVRVHQDLRAKASVGIHWGTFHGLCDEPLDQAPVDLAAARRAHSVGEGEFSLMALGETRKLPRRAGSAAPAMPLAQNAQK